jgi:D-lactate dehydrogenase (cytochrome)
VTDDATAISRASAAFAKLDSMVDSMRRNGTLAQFNHAYRIRHAAAISRGEGFMAFGQGKQRFLEPELGSASVTAMRAIKLALDPTGIMNPRKIF